MLYSHISKISLPSEIILMIVEAMNYDSRLFGKLMCISKDFRRLIKANESSLSAHFARQHPPTYVPLMSSRFASAPLYLPPRTFHWLDELYRRSVVTKELVTKRFREVIATIDEFFPDLDNEDYCSNCLTVRVAAFQRLSVQLLFRIFDARHDNSHAGRLAQEEVIRSMTALDLGAVNFLLSTTSIYYSHHSICDCERSVEVQREIQSVFRELALQHGPYLIWTSLFASDAKKQRIGKHVEKGLGELRAYETSMSVVVGEVLAGRSLQSVLMREFCNKKQCDLADGWATIFQVVRDEVLFPDSDKPHTH